MVPGDELLESLKESNRRQADHIGVKLKAVGCGIAPLTDWEAERFQFTPEEVERMAEMEHRRFVEEWLRAGWTYAPGPKNLERRTSPDLVPWDELPEAEEGSQCCARVAALPGAGRVAGVSAKLKAPVAGFQRGGPIHA